MSKQYYFFGTRTTFIKAAPKSFCRVNGALQSRNSCFLCRTYSKIIFWTIFTENKTRVNMTIFRQKCFSTIFRYFYSLKMLVSSVEQIQRLFYSLFFGEIQPQKNRFLIFWIKKNAFKTERVKFEKRPKTGKFAKGLVHGFCQKIVIFLMRNFLKKLATKEGFLIFWIKKNVF